eukprot:6210114-Pleurochrysis_carterae.AAC.2
MRREVHDMTPAGLPVILPSTNGMRAAQSGRQLKIKDILNGTKAVCAASLTGPYATELKPYYVVDVSKRSRHWEPQNEKYEASTSERMNAPKANRPKVSLVSRATGLAIAYSPTPGGSPKATTTAAASAPLRAALVRART